jgi:hypothetical protein
MNAYELADALQYCGDGGYNLDAAIMIRQQQAEIDSLRKQLKAACNALMELKK